MELPELAPIALFVFNRPVHTERTLQALLANTLAAESAVYIFQDGARGEGDVRACGEVAEICRAVTGFARVSFIPSPTNHGCANSIINGINHVLQKHSRIIVLEDDIITSKHFLSFINSALDKYAGSPRLKAVCGYNHPPEKMSMPDISDDAFFSLRFQGWGWGTWRDSWEETDWQVAGYEEFAADASAVLEFNRGGGDLAPMLEMQMQGRIDAWDIRFSFDQFRKNQLCLCPVHSYTDNIGLDASGTHCGEVFDFIHNDLSLAGGDFSLPGIGEGLAVLPDIEAAVCAAHSPVRRGFIQRQVRSVRKRLYKWFGVR